MDAETLLAGMGPYVLLGLAAIVFIESGVLFPFVPGDSLLVTAAILRTDRLEAAEAFFAQRGPIALVLGRFLPIVRTYVPFAAGTADMPYRRFTGAVGWVVLMVAVGVLLGGIPGIAHSIDLIMMVVVGMSVLTTA
ncbi:Inner membrane protein YghB [Corynebacterium capitovis DSM 44611]|nr:VTT domain-containing protein [Corynebacterium capitovis]WKD56630.1 Inner membrane protein YghB [Corynebacterium capitovis DSM 44611]